MQSIRRWWWKSLICKLIGSNNEYVLRLQGTLSSMLSSIPQLTHFIQIMNVCWTTKQHNILCTNEWKKVCRKLYEYTKLRNQTEYTPNNIEAISNMNMMVYVWVNLGFSFYEHRRHRVHLNPKQWVGAGKRAICQMPPSSAHRFAESYRRTCWAFWPHTHACVCIDIDTI